MLRDGTDFDVGKLNVEESPFETHGECRRSGHEIGVIAEAED